MNDSQPNRKVRRALQSMERRNAKQVRIPFWDTELVAVQEDGGEPMVAIKPICDAIGIASCSQLLKIKEDPRFSCHDIISTGADGKQYKMSCLPLSELRPFLYTISPNRVKKEIAERLLAFQLKCHQAINLYFSGEMVTPAAAQELRQQLAAALKAVAELTVAVREEREARLRLEEKIQNLTGFSASQAGRVLQYQKALNDIH